MPTHLYQCRHIFTEGRRCGSPALRGEQLCYFHHGTRGLAARSHHDLPLGRRSVFDIPTLEDRSAIQLALGEVLSRISSNHLDPRRAGLLLYGLQIASLNLPRPHPHDLPEPTVDTVIDDPNLGPLAPPAEFLEPSNPSTEAAFLLHQLSLDDEPLPAPQDPHLADAFEAEPEVSDETIEPEPSIDAAQQPAAPEEILPTLQACASTSRFRSRPNSAPHRILPCQRTRGTKRSILHPASNSSKLLHRSKETAR